MDHTEQIRQRTLAVARAVIDGKIGILEGAHALHYTSQFCPELFGKDGTLFKAIESETDDLPIGKIRELWHPDVLLEKDVEITRCEELWREQVVAACKRILLRNETVR